MITQLDLVLNAVRDAMREVDKNFNAALLKIPEDQRVILVNEMDSWQDIFNEQLESWETGVRMEHSNGYDLIQHPNFKGVLTDEGKVKWIPKE